MIETTQLIKNLVDEKPSEFASNFDAIMKDRISQAVDAKKVELSSTLFGAPEAADSELDTEDQTDGEETETSDAE